MWANWAANQRVQPRRVTRPAPVAQVLLAVQNAAEHGETVRPVGAGHA
jgi:L-gulono-1,4-lactone dehydrogenase